MSSSNVPPSDSSSSRLKRSRNGCQECRRLHRRCGEEKPSCQNCREGGKVCSYQKPLSWGGRPFKKSTFGDALGSGVVEIPIIDAEDDPPYRRSFVYGQAGSSGSTTNSLTEVKVEPRSKSVPAASSTGTEGSTPGSQTGDLSLPPAWLPWLSRHHRSLFYHFVESTITMFTMKPAEQQEIRSAIIPMAVYTNHGFSLVAAIIALASTHRMNLGLNQDTSEIEYWKDMSVGHLRRPTVQEDESTEDVFAGTALILAIRDVIAETDQSTSWKLHLQGALTLFARSGETASTTLTEARRALQRIARSLQIRAPLPFSTSPSRSGNQEQKQQAESDTEVIAMPNVLSAIFYQIRSLRLEKNALQNIETNSGATNMQPLWGALKGQCLEIIVRLKEFSENVSRDSDADSDNHRLNAYLALIQVYAGILDLSISDSGLRNTIDMAMGTLRSANTSESDSPIDPSLVLALFTIGCFVRSIDDRQLIQSLLARIAQQHGKGNAGLAMTFLKDLWTTTDSRNQLVNQARVDRLIAERGCEISLW